eukprot:3369873-Amphidinium_carterae.1
MAEGDRILFGHEDGCYLTVNHPNTDPGKDGAPWRTIIDSDDCFLPERNNTNPLETLVPTRAEWESISRAIRQEKFSMRTFCRMVQKNIRYKQGDQLIEAQVWVGEELPEYERYLMQQEFTVIYIDATESTVEREELARGLYRKVIRFVKAMIIATTEVRIPPYIMHGWRKPPGLASNVWWERQGWLQAIHADSLVRVKLFHPDRFGNISWDEDEIGVAGRGAVNEKGIVVSRKKHVSENLEQIMVDLENHDRRVRGELARQRAADKPKPTRAAPTARCVPWTDAHFIQGGHVRFQILYLTGSMCDRTLCDIYTSQHLNREVGRGLHPVAIMFMQKMSYICRLFHVIQCEGARDWSFEIAGDSPSWDDHAVSLEKTYLKMVTDLGFHEYACPSPNDFREIARMASHDEPDNAIDPFLWDMIYERYWSFPSPVFVNRPTLVIADSVLNHSGRSGASNMSGYLRQYSRKHFEFGLNSGGNAKEIAKSIRENGGTNWNTRNEKELIPGHMCNLIVLWMFNEICQAGGGNSLITRDKAQLRIHIEEGVDAIQEAVRQAEYTRVFVLCGGDALAWNMPPVWNELAAARLFRQSGTPAITGGGPLEASSERSI